MHDPHEPSGNEPPADVPATMGLGRLAATVERLRREVREAHAAADGRALIELAKGILVERLGCNPAEAARQLAGLAEKAGLSPLELAADIVNQAARDRMTQAAGEFLSAATGDGDAEKLSVAVRLRTAESGALAAADTQAVAESLLEHALVPLGAHAVAVWAAGMDASLTLAGSAGFGEEEARRWRYVPPASRHRPGRRCWSDARCGGPICPGRACRRSGTAGTPPRGASRCPRARAGGSSACWRSPGRTRCRRSRLRSSGRWRRWPSWPRTPWRPARGRWRTSRVRSSWTWPTVCTTRRWCCARTSTPTGGSPTSASTTSTGSSWTSPAALAAW
ncbi:ANTAR domain-containing protein [Thermocatellispora tengchongensis]|uniref:ANTAR domain-containing protein n=1 Tax=Thermocatellispora tengchongensis TaxID=1073253 RepID=UPI00362EDC1F